MYENTGIRSNTVNIILKNGQKKDKKKGKTWHSKETIKHITKVLQMLRKYYKNISKIFQIVLTFLSKCNIYNTKKNT